MHVNRENCRRLRLWQFPAQSPATLSREDEMKLHLISLTVLGIATVRTFAGEQALADCEAVLAPVIQGNEHGARGGWRFRQY